MKNKNKIFTGIITSLVLFSTTFAADTVYKLQSIVPESTSLLKVSFDKPIPGSEIISDLKVFKDIEVKSVEKDSTDPTKLTLNLNSSIEVGKTYNVFGVFGVESSVDFVIGDSFNVKLTTKDQAVGQSITRVAVKNSKVLELYFKESLSGNEFEFKVLEDLPVLNVGLNLGAISIQTATNLASKTNYILMVISLSDKAGVDYTLDESIYDFSTPDFTSLPVNGSGATSTELDNLNSAVTVSSTGVITTGISVTGTGVMTSGINVGTGILVNSASGATSTGNLMAVASKVKETPDTGAETWVLMLLTLIINSFYFLTRRTALKS